MFASHAVAIVLASLFCVTVAASAETFVDLPDSRNDVELSGVSVPVGGLDLLRLESGLEGNDAFFTLELAATERPSGSTVGLGFQRGETRYEIVNGAASCPGGLLRRIDINSDRVRTVDCLENLGDGQRLRYLVPASLIVDHHGVPLLSGQAVEDLAAWSASTPPTQASDELIGEQDSWTVPVEGPGFHLVSKRPVMSTNGDLTTLAFNVTLVNVGLDSLDVALSPQSFPAEWKLFGPSRLQVPSADAHSFLVLVEVPSRHAHGELTTFDYVASKLDEPAQSSSLTLGVRWLDVPQPSHHHPRLHIHTRTDGDAQEAWISAAENDPDPSATDGALVLLRPGGEQPSPLSVGQLQTPELVLDPALEVGLAFRDLGSVRAHFEVLTEAEATASARLLVWHCDHARPVDVPGCPTGAGSYSTYTEILSARTDTTIAASGGKLVFDFDVPMEGLTLPSSPDADLVVQFVLDGETFTDALLLGRDAQLDVQNSWIDLPLDNVHTTLPFDLPLSVDLVPIGLTSRTANPGDEVSFTFEVRKEGTFKIEPFGFGSDFVSAPKVIQSDGTGRFELRVKVPADAVTGILVDILVLVQSGDAQGLQRIEVHVVPDSVEAVPSDADAKQASALGLVPALAALVLAIGWNRARRP